MKRGLQKGWASLLHDRVFLQLVWLNGLVAVSGFAKDFSLATYLGTGPLADIFTEVFFFFDTVVYVMIGPSINVAFATVFGGVGLTNRNILIAFRNSLSLVILLSGVLGLVILACIAPILRLFTQVNSSMQLIHHMFLYLLPIVVAYPLYCAFSGALQALNRFAWVGFIPNMLNISVIIGVMYLRLERVTQAQGVQDIALSYSIGTVVMLVVIAYLGVRVIRTRQRFSPECNELSNQSNSLSSFGVVKHLTRVTVVYGTYLGTQQTVSLTERLLTMHAQTGSIAALTYALRLAQLPNWVVIAAAGTLLSPRLASTEMLDQHHKSQRSVLNALWLCVCICIPSSAAFMLLKTPIVKMLFEHGAFNVYSVRLTVHFLTGYSISILPQSMSVILYRTALAKRLFALPILVCCLSSAINILFDVAFFRVLGPITLGIGVTIGSVLSTVILLVAVCDDRAYLANYTDES